MSTANTMILEPNRPARKKRLGRRRLSVSAEVDGMDFSRNKKIDVVLPRKVFKKPEELERIRSATKKNFLFSDMQEDQSKVLFDAMIKLTKPAGSTIIQQGDKQADYFYVLDEGICEVYVDKQKVLEYEPGSCFGELALMYNCPRAASIIAKSDCALWALDRNTFRQLLCGGQSQKRHQYEDILRKSNVLKVLSSEEIAKLANSLSEKSFDPDEVILQEGNADYKKMKFYVILEGLAEATKEIEGGKKISIGDLTSGDVFGEKALLERKPRAATITAKTKLKCAYLDIKGFERLLGKCRKTFQIKSQTDLAMTNEALRKSQVEPNRQSLNVVSPAFTQNQEPRPKPTANEIKSKNPPKCWEIKKNEGNFESTRDGNAKTLLGCSVFDNMKIEAILRIADVTKSYVMQEGEHVLRGQAFYLVVEGEGTFYTKDSSKSMLVKPATVFGHEALIDSYCGDMFIDCKTDITCIALGIDEFNKLPSSTKSNLIHFIENDLKSSKLLEKKKNMLMVGSALSVLTCMLLATQYVMKNRN